MEKQFSILVVDDEILWTEKISDILENITDVNIYVANSAETAFQAINTKHYDIAICDLRLVDASPNDQTGTNLISYINKNSPNTKIIVLSGYVTPNISAMLLKSGIRNIISKVHINRSDFRRLIQYELKEHISNNSTIAYEPPEIEEIPEDTLDFLENILHGYLHNLYKYISVARLNIQLVYHLIEEEQKKVDPEILTELDSISKSIDGMRFISERLRNLAGREPTFFKLLDINKLINEVINQTDYIKSEKLLLELEKDLPNIEGDRELLWHLIENLISNAIEAIDKKKEKVVIKTEKAQSNEQIKVIISDNGRGIAKENLPHIFKLNFSTKPSGLGIGLYLVKKCVKFHRGEIFCHSTFGKGTSFEVILPIRRNTK